ncbi:MAG: hypothetical protein JWM27_2929 [Gemmatimonadetes bacterium]|nr:hypothetical protein [Gemmatimonadota bacterium]
MMRREPPWGEAQTMMVESAMVPHGMDAAIGSRHCDKPTRRPNGCQPVQAYVQQQDGSPPDPRLTGRPPTV